MPFQEPQAPLLRPPTSEWVDVSCCINNDEQTHHSHSLGKCCAISQRYPSLNATPLSKPHAPPPPTSEWVNVSCCVTNDEQVVVMCG